MTFSPFRDKRVVVPRWRPTALAVGMGQLAIPIKGHIKLTSHIPVDLQNRLEAWRTQPHIISASELVEAAIVDGAEAEAIRAAQLIVAPEFDGDTIGKATS